MGVERERSVNGRGAKETHAEEQRSPNVTALTVTKKTERDENERKKDGNVAVNSNAERAQNVAAVKLGDGQEIERSSEKPDPGSAANWMKQERAGRDAGM